MKPALALRTAVVALALGAAGACGGGGDDVDLGPVLGRESPPEPAPEIPRPEPYRPAAAEEYPNGKRVAATIAQRVTTYEPGASAAALAARLGPASVDREALARTISPLVEPDARSTGDVVYPQLAGVTPTSLGAMVAVRQTIERDGSRESVVRVLDVRLRLADGRWLLEQIGSVGGDEAQRPENLSPAAQRLLADPGVELSDSARWDIYRGGVDEGLLDALANAGREHDFAVGVLDSGHPEEVWATTRRSAHSVGYAADIYEVDGRLVIDQREPGSAAHRLAGILAAGAVQIGSPWLFGPGSFTDAVHQDHLHVQRSPTP